MTMNKLDKYQKQLKKWQSKRSKSAEKELMTLYRAMVREVLVEVGNLYKKYEKDGVLTFVEMAKYDRLNTFLKSLGTHTTQLNRAYRKSIERVLLDSYEYSYYWMAFSIETVAAASIGTVALTNELMKKALDNPVRGLTLSETLEKNRIDVVYKINQTVKQGLHQGMTYKQMAENLEGTLEGDYNKAMRIVRTETHRVNEQAEIEVMERAHAKGVKSTKEWNCSLDERVRKTRKANHRKLHGQKVFVDEMFDLGGSKQGKAPSNTSYPEHDINCRCFLVYDVIAIEAKTNEELANLTFEDWKQTLK